MCVLVFQRKPCLHLMTRFNFLKHLQHFDVLNSNLNKEKEKKKEKYIETSNIKRHFKN